VASRAERKQQGVRAAARAESAQRADLRKPARREGHVVTTAVDVLLLTQPACDFCDHAKAVLARLQQEFELNVEVADLDSPNGRQLAQTLGIVFAPGVLLDGELFSYGRPSERKLRKELQRRTTTA